MHIIYISHVKKKTGPHGVYEYSRDLLIEIIEKEKEKGKSIIRYCDIYECNIRLYLSLYVNYLKRYDNVQRQC